MKGSSSDQAGEMLSALVDELGVDPTELGKRTLRVWRARSPRLVMQGEERGENPAATATRFMEMLLGSLRSDNEPNWSDCEQRSREYGRMRARQAVPLEFLIDELAVYRRATMELISTPLLESTRRDEIVALAQGRLEDVTDHLNQSIAAGYLACVEARRPPRSCLATAMSVIGRSSMYIARSVSNRVATTIAALGRRARGPRATSEVAPGGRRSGRVVRQRPLLPNVAHGRIEPAG